MENYGPPVDQLLRIGEDLRYGRGWHDYSGMGIGPEQIPDLIRMAVDEDLNEAHSENAEVWAPVHAWRALGTLRAEPAIPILIKIMAGQDEDGFDDWITEEMPTIFGMIGPAAIPELSALLEREDGGDFARGDAARSLVQIAIRNPGERPEIVATLSRVLERAEWHDPGFNGFLVSDLIDLEAREAAEVIQRAYAGEFVDDSICGTWYDVWHSLDLDGEPPPRTERSYHLVRDPLFEEPVEPPPTFAKPYSWQPAELKTPDERKDRNKARQKLEKKVKKKGG